MRVLLLAPMGALTACGDAGDFLNQSSYGTGEPSYSQEGTDGDPEQEEEDLTGGYASCEEALVAEGEDPTVFTDDYGMFTIYLLEDWANERPWLVTLSFLEDGSSMLSCGEMRGSRASTPVKEDLSEYWNCAYAWGHLSIYDPESDSGCNQGYEDYAYQGSEYFVKESPGVFVREEEEDQDED